MVTIEDAVIAISVMECSMQVRTNMFAFICNPVRNPFSLGTAQAVNTRLMFDSVTCYSSRAALFLDIRMHC